MKEPEWIDVGDVGAQDSTAKLKGHVDKLLKAKGVRGSIATYVNVIEPAPGFADQNPAAFHSHVFETLATMMPSLPDKARAALGRGEVLFVHGRTGERQRTVALVVTQ